jgi:hypothetical protein
MENQTTWIKSKMTTALGADSIGKLEQLVTGLSAETNVNNVSKLLVYLMETKSLPVAETTVNIEETEVYQDLKNRFTILQTQTGKPLVNVEETEVYLDLLERFTELETKHRQLSTQPPVNIKETEVYQDLKDRFTILETTHKVSEKEHRKTTQLLDAETARNLLLTNELAKLQTEVNQTLTDGKPKSTFYWEG